MSGQQEDQEVVELRPNHFGIMRWSTVHVCAGHRLNKTFFIVKNVDQRVKYLVLFHSSSFPHKVYLQANC